MAPITPRSSFAGTDASVGFMWGASITACLVLIGVCLRLVVVVSRRGKQRQRYSTKEKIKPSHSTHTHKARPHGSRTVITSPPRDELPLYEKIRHHKPTEVRKTREPRKKSTLTPPQDQYKIFSLSSLQRTLRPGARATEQQLRYPSMQHIDAGLNTRPAPKPRVGRIPAAGRALWQTVFKEKRASSFVSYDVLHKPLSRFSSKNSNKSQGRREAYRKVEEPSPYVANKHPGHFFEQYHVKPLHTPYLPSPKPPSQPDEATPATPAQPEVVEPSPVQPQMLVVPVHNRALSLASSPGPAFEPLGEHAGDESPKYPVTASSRYSTLADTERYSVNSSIMPDTPLPVVPPLHLMRFPGLPQGPALPVQSHRSLPMSPPPTRSLPILPSPPLSPFSHSDDDFGASRYTSMRTSSVFSLEPEDPTQRYTLLLAQPPPTMAKTGKLPDGGLHIWMEEESLNY